MSSLLHIFDIKTKKGKLIYLTSSSNKVFYNNNIYYPYSGLNLVSITSDDSGDNFAVISGIYNENGIQKEADLSDAEITIQQIFQGKARLLGQVFCISSSKCDLSFTLYCNSEIIKYNQPLLKVFSKTCRANFGDNECQVKIEDYNFETEIVELSHNRIKCKEQPEQDEIFTLGKAILLGKNREDFFTTKITAHTGNLIEIEVPDKINLSIYKKIRLIPGCNKKYRTCCYSFNNAVNFRGEPHIPELNIIDN